VQISVTSSEQIQVYRLGPVVTIFVPLLAIFLQAYVPIYLPFFTVLDLPLLVTIFFAVARRGPISGLLTGGLIGIVQDSLTHQPIGLYGIAKTIIGFLASSLGVKLDVENPGSRVLMTFIFYLLHQLIYLAVARGLAREVLQLRWGHLLIAGAVNAALAVPLFALLDRAKRRA
jgi:rod shape-determining protein MreD